MAYELTAWSALRQQAMLDLDLGILIPNADFDAAAATSITSAKNLRDTNMGSTQW